MNNRKLTLVLYAAGGAAVLGLLAAFFGGFYGVYPGLAAENRPLTFCLWMILLLYLAAMCLYFMICRRIGEDRSFSRENGRDLLWIARTLWAAAALWLGGLALRLVPGLVFPVFWTGDTILLCGASAALGALAWVLSRLVQRAAELQAENDLTV